MKRTWSYRPGTPASVGLPKKSVSPSLVLLTAGLSLIFVIMVTSIVVMMSIPAKMSDNPGLSANIPHHQTYKELHDP